MPSIELIYERAVAAVRLLKELKDMSPSRTLLQIMASRATA